MRKSLPIYLESPASDPGRLIHTLVEIDHRRGSIGLQYATGAGQPVRTSGALWLLPDQAEAVAFALLSAVNEWRAEQATIAWTTVGEVAR